MSLTFFNATPTEKIKRCNIREHVGQGVILSFPVHQSRHISSTCHAVKNPSVEMIHLAEKIAMQEILLISEQWLVAIRTVKEYLAGTVISLSNSQS